MHGRAAARGDAASLWGCRNTEPPLHFKDAAAFIDHGGGNLEARLQDMQGLITPNRFFFVRNNSASLDLDAAGWRLAVEGDAIAKPLELSYDAIRNLPSRTLISYLECGGNHRAMFDLVKGQPAQGTQWMTGAVGNGEWTGVSPSGGADAGRHYRGCCQRAPDWAG